MGRLALLLLAYGWVSRAAAADAPGCPHPPEHYEGFALRRTTWRTPFSLPGIAASAIGKRLGEGAKTYSGAEAKRLTGAAVEAVTASPLLETPVRVTAAAAFLENCDEANRTVDLVVYLLAFRPTLTTLWTFEGGRELRADPKGNAGVVPAGWRVAAMPTARANETDLFVAGGKFELQSPGARFRVTGDGEGSPAYAAARLSLSGSFTPEKAALWTASYGAGFRYRDQELLARELRQGYAFAWASAATRPLSALGGAFRYAAQFERGYQVFSGDTRYSAWKLLGGASGGRGRHGYSINAGFQIGSAGGVANAFRKGLVDGTYGIRWIPPGRRFDHRSLDAEIRVSGGWLSAGNGVAAPPNERLFGGVRERRFTEIPGWEMAASPVIRSFPANRFLAPSFGRTGAGERFWSLNFTGAFTAVRRPLLPREVRDSEEFRNAIQAGKGTALSALESYHESRDPAMQEAAAPAARLAPVLDALLEALQKIEVADEGAREAYENCLTAAETSQSALEGALEQTSFAVLVGHAPGSLPFLLEACGKKFGHPSIASSLPAVEQARAEIETLVRDQVDHASVRKRAREDAALAIRALDAIQNELNLFSLDPVVIFDRAYAAAGSGADRGIARYAAGGGLRLTLASHVSFEGGYAVNVNRGPGEPRGAFFFRLRVHELIR